MSGESPNRSDHKPTAPITEPKPTTTARPRRRTPRGSRARRIGLHLLRACLVGTVVVCFATADPPVPAGDVVQTEAIVWETVRETFPTAETLARKDGAEAIIIENADGQSLGQVTRTSPGSDHIIGFSGPTDLLLILDSDGVVRTVRVLSSGDTEEHVQAILDDGFLDREYVGSDYRSVVDRPARSDAVSGATLTAIAMQDAIRYRLAGHAPTVRFPETITREPVRAILPEVAEIQRKGSDRSARFDLLDAEGDRIGWLLRTSPAADSIVGYQGPTESFLVFDPDDVVLGLIVDDSFDNEPYVGYVREDRWNFLLAFNGRTLAELADETLESSGMEGVSGATMTSQAVAEGLFLAAKREWRRRQQDETEEPVTAPPPTPWWSGWRTAVDLALVLLAIVVAFTRLRGVRWFRPVFLLLLVIGLGFVTGDMLSQAMLAGWSRHGVPSSAGWGLIMITAVALVVPLTSRTNLYCSHLCPHGAVQQLVRNRLPWRVRIGRRTGAILACIPGVLLGVVIIVTLTRWSLPLVGIEPFDAYHLTIAGVATITIAIAGVIAALFVPMAYCHFGCPTGALLQFLRYHSRSDRWTWRDWSALGLTGLAVTLRFFG